MLRKNWLLGIVLTILTMLFMVGCGAKQAENNETQVFENASIIGTGDITFTLTIVDENKAETVLTINTDKKTVGEALQDNKLVAGKKDNFGLYIKTVNGITADYDKDGVYWAFYVNGEYSPTGVDFTEIVPEAEYSLRVER
ncbi:MAG: DUF4430 domain-containing protein [Oscillospiraceae bacterium]|nr:DUF4430 domain-containing protein [Oscillospiraceae bacterium]